MTKYTVNDLIKELEKFPKNLPIETELAFMWNYPTELLEYFEDYDEDDFVLLTQANALDLCIFEGSWEKNVSNVDGKFEEYFKPMGETID